jgi:hypothetical protein
MTDTSVVDALLHPPIELLQVTTAGLMNPYGPGLTDLPMGAVGRPTYGLTWEVAGAAPGLGRTVGVITRFERRLFQCVIFNSLHIFGETFAAETFESDLESGVHFNQFAVPQGYSVFISPGVFLTFNWLVGFP